MEPKKYEIRLLQALDREKYIRCSIFPVKTNDVVSFCGIVEDITVARHNKTHIEQINARKNATLEILSHDLKEPLALMKLMASSIKADIEKTGNQRLVDSLQFITQMCERNMKLVRSIINHEFLKSSVIEIKRERVDIVWEIQDVIRTYQKSHLKELKDFRFESSSDKIYLHLDSMKFMQVINNLISNAIKFTEMGGVIAIKIQEKKDSVLVIVSDDGIGIPDDLKPKLFDKGGEALRTGLSGEESSGLGMSIIKSIVELHKGEIWFESEEGKGTTFYISLPK
jgi:signal transduction histidine kinase